MSQPAFFGSDFALDALEQALYARSRYFGPDLFPPNSGLGVQCMSIRYTGRLAEAGIELSLCGVGDSYDNALAETIILALQDGGDPPA